MKEGLNNTGVLLEGLSETEIKLAIELYRLAGFKSINANLLIFERDNAVGVFKGDIDLWNTEVDDLDLITLNKLAFESGLNPDWAERVVLTGNGDFAWESRCKILKLNGDVVPMLTRFKSVIEKQTENWSEQDEKRQENVMQNGNEGLHYPDGIHQGDRVFKSSEEQARYLSKKTNTEIAQDLAIPKQASKYDIVVADKFTGQQVTIDVYALLKALPVRKSPEVEHSIKKLLAAGVRNGGKSYKQDIEEARNQLNLELDYLELMEKLK